ANTCTRVHKSWLSAVMSMRVVRSMALLLVGLTHSDAATASLLLNLEVVFTAVLAWVVFHEATSRQVVIGFAAIFAAGLALAWPAQLAAPGRSLGLVLIAAACLCWALDNNLTRKISAADSRVIAAFKGLVAGTANA